MLKIVGTLVALLSIELAERKRASGKIQCGTALTALPGIRLRCARRDGTTSPNLACNAEY